MQIPGKALHGYEPFPQRTHSTCAGLNVRRAEGKMCQWPIDMRCLLPSYSVSIPRRNNLAGSRTAKLQGIIDRSASLGVEFRRNAGVVAEG